MGSDHTSDIQKRIYDFIVEYIRVEGMPPTNREHGTRGLPPLDAREKGAD